MYENIIVALSLDHGIGEIAIETARKLLSEGGHITIAHVCEPPNSAAVAMVGDEIFEKVLLDAKSRLSERVVDNSDIQTKVLRGNPGRTLTDYASEVGADCIVVGSHKPGLSDYFLGSTAARIVRYASCSVHVVR